MNRFFRFCFMMLPLVLFGAGCRGQAPVTPPPTVSVSDAALTCPATYTCGYIVSWATCTSASVCPTPASNGPYTPIQTAAAPLSTPSYIGPAPVTGAYVAFAFQFVETPSGGTPETGVPSLPSAAQLVALYPGTPETPSVTTTAELAPPLGNSQPEISSNVARMAKPAVKIFWK